METLVLLGDEALAQGALDAGISGFYAYRHSIDRDRGVCSKEQASKR